MQEKPEDGDIVIAAECFSIVVDAEAWRVLGYHKRPKNGLLFQFFRSSWKVELEKAIARELVALMFGAFISYGAITRERGVRACAYFLGQDGVCEALGYGGVDAAQCDLNERIEVYAIAPRDKWAVALMHRLAPQTIPDKRVAAKLLVGCPELAVRVSQVAAKRAQGGAVQSEGDSRNVFDWYFAEKKRRQKAEQLDALMTVASWHAEAVEAGGDCDEIRGGFGEYGLEATNPVPVHGISENERYLERLRWQGKPVSWDRIGSFEADNISMPIDAYELYDDESNLIKTVYISPYHRRTSCKPPEGFSLIARQ